MPKIHQKSGVSESSWTEHCLNDVKCEAVMVRKAPVSAKDLGRDTPNHTTFCTLGDHLNPQVEWEVSLLPTEAVLTLDTGSSAMIPIGPAEEGHYTATVFHFMSNTSKVLNHTNISNKYVMSLQENTGQLQAIRLSSWYFHLCLLFEKIKGRNSTSVMLPLWSKNVPSKQQNTNSSLPACLKSVQLSDFADCLWPRR